MCWCLWNSEEGIRTPGTGITDVCGLLCGCWGLNLGPPQEQSLLLNAEHWLQCFLFSVIKVSFRYNEGMVGVDACNPNSAEAEKEGAELEAA